MVEPTKPGLNRPVFQGGWDHVHGYFQMVEDFSNDFDIRDEGYDDHEGFAARTDQRIDVHDPFHQSGPGQSIGSFGWGGQGRLVGGGLVGLVGGGLVGQVLSGRPCCWDERGRRWGWRFIPWIQVDRSP